MSGACKLTKQLTASSYCSFLQIKSMKHTYRKKIMLETILSFTLENTTNIVKVVNPKCQVYLT